MLNSELQQNYGSFFQPELLKEINEIAIQKEVKAGEELIKYNDYIRSMPLILKGSIKILREDENGDELLLYFLEKGDTCAMTLACCLGDKKSEIKAIAEIDSTLLMIPIQKMEEWSSKYKSWRNFVFDSYHHRLMEVLQSIDNIAFSKLDSRLIKYLEHKKEVFNSNYIEITHQDIARDLNSSRVVISRLLKKLENQKKIELYRNAIKLIAV
ncbi:CRP/FNR family transcriptional regulator, anaerobic regulatory protein [Mesonia phycicola]|uniref:CRP/FNR family transcriptional regulator, anaerobic regulatory protein n=1 Tax=Mesonia phycicola TaxID=579105 RepID=A0A1M6C0F6_9FLAO|nr:Crp/Fnr family transcriptional regulator [Mesonia phycicola]SHI54539.1 CRP/FNR family transcriptional regulator, anaerobic regulatory protein [Mesonia phycicola]